MEERAAPRERIVRVDGRDADDVVGSREVCRRVSRGVAAARRARDGADRAFVAARDAAGVAPGAGVGIVERAVELGRLRLRFADFAELPVPDDRVARRWTARVRHADALAAGIWCWPDRV